jgi:hypothetical protein
VRRLGAAAADRVTGGRTAGGADNRDHDDQGAKSEGRTQDLADAHVARAGGHEQRYEHDGVGHESGEECGRHRSSSGGRGDQDARQQESECGAADGAEAVAEACSRGADVRIVTRSGYGEETRSQAHAQESAQRTPPDKRLQVDSAAFQTSRS